MILAIETSTPDAGLAVFDTARGEVVWQREFTSDRAHNAAIFAPLDEALENYAVDAVVVGTGPGSYSGVRVGIAVANGVSLARGVPCFGLPSLAALPAEEGAGDYRVIGDARRGEFFIVEVCGRELQGAAQMMTAEDLAKRLEDGEGGLRIYTMEESVVARFDGAELLRPSAGELARLAAGLSEKQRGDLAELALEPVYLRAPHITMPKRKIL